MTILYRVTLIAHVVAGVLALATFWIPLVARKGGRVHRRAGWVYVVAAGAIAVTGAVLCVRLMTDGNAGHRRSGFFLAYVALFAWASAQLGLRALRSKRRTQASRSAVDLLPPALLLAGGVALAAYGVVASRILFVVFAGLGAVQGASQLRFWRAPPRSTRAWFFTHMLGMGSSCITTITAFVVVNGPRLGLRIFDLRLWLVPIAAGSAGLALWQRYYEKRFASGGSQGVVDEGDGPGLPEIGDVG